jgi:hypothetical protein
MRRLTISLALCATLAIPVAGQRAAGPVAYTDAARALAESPAFGVQGEYIGTVTGSGGATMPAGLQVVATGDNTVQLVLHRGGLPGAGSDGRNTTMATARVDGNNLHVLSGGLDRIVRTGDTLTAHRGSTVAWTMKRTERTSPTLGAPAPAGAVVLFDGTNTDAFEDGRMTPDRLLTEGTKTRQSFRDFSLHLEFQLPYKPTVFPGDQDRGNSGLYIFDRYEVQVIDSFGLHYYDADTWSAAFERDWNHRPPSRFTQWGGSLYLTRPPDIAMNLPPLTWQTYDIEFTAPRFSADGQKTSNARITLRHNGVLVHDNVELRTGTGAGGKRPEIAEGPLVLQDHTNPVRFRNIWLVPR